MLLQTNSYIVPREKRAEHAKLLRRFRQTLLRLGCDHFEVYEQVGPNWNTGEPTNRFVQIMRFRDRAHQQEVQNAERSDSAAQAVIADFCELINFNYQQQQGMFAQGFYTSFMRVPPTNSQQSSPAQTVHEIPPSEDSSQPPIATISGDHSQTLEDAPPIGDSHPDDSDPNAAQYGSGESGINEPAEDESNETMIEVEARPVPTTLEDELESPTEDTLDDTARLSDSDDHAPTQPGNNGHAKAEDNQH